VRHSIVIALIVASPLEPSPPDTNRSSAALEELRKELSGETVAWSDLPKKQFASVPLTKADAAVARDMLWKAHVARLVKERAAEVQARKLIDGKHEMPFSMTRFGQKPQAGHSLWISMHGGGNATARVNDRQWENQKRLYKLDEGIYVAPRAPTNTWNLWHEPHIDRFFARLIENLIALENVDPNRVYLLGYSAGGDGVYQLTPRTADRWSAAGMMAGHPNDASPLGLRNVAFALQVGERDGAFNRNKVAEEWGKELDRLRNDDPGGYAHLVKLHSGKGHWMDRVDAAALPWMAKHTRNPIPERVVWKQASVTHDSLYWLGVPPGSAQPGSIVIASRSGQAIDVVKAEGVTKLIVRIDDRCANLDEPIRITQSGRSLYDGLATRTIGTLVTTLLARGDPHSMFSAEIPVSCD
jgi:poly(3-hydroxybutyrate) depolymerase